MCKKVHFSNRFLANSFLYRVPLRNEEGKEEIMIGPGGRDSVSGNLILKQPWGTAITKRPDRETPRRAERVRDFTHRTGGQVVRCFLSNGVCLVPDMISFLKSL